MTHPVCDLPDNAPDELVPDPQVAREFNVTLMTLWRWDRDPRLAELGWEPPVKIRRRNYRRRRPLEKFKAALRNFGIAALRGSAAIDRRAAGAWRRATRMISIPERRRVEAAAYYPLPDVTRRQARRPRHPGDRFQLCCTTEITVRPSTRRRH
jgi:hypothetical protein